MKESIQNQKLQHLLPVAFIFILASFVHWPNYIKVAHFSLTNWLILIALLPMIYILLKVKLDFVKQFGKFYIYFILFFCIAVGTSVINTNFEHKSFFQNTFVYLSFFIVLSYSSRYSHFITVQFLHKLFGFIFFLLTVWVCQGLYAYGLAWGDNNNVLYRPVPMLDGRSVALVMLLVISWYLAYFKYTLRYRYFFLALFGANVIFLSLSRVALFMALLIVIIGIFKTPKIQRKMAMIMFSLTLLFWSFATAWFNTPLKKRYLNSFNISFIQNYDYFKDLGVVKTVAGNDYFKDLGVVKLDTSGRSALWSTTFISFKETPFFGKGIGSSEVELLRRLPSYRQTLTCNDHLRIMHDAGIIGYGLVILQILVIIKNIIMKCQIYYHGEKALLLNNAFLSLLIVLIMGVTENILLFSYVMLPLAVIIGSIYQELGLEHIDASLEKFQQGHK